MISPFKGENNNVYHADTCAALVDAHERNKVEFKALARHTYPGNRLTDETMGLSTIGYWSAKDKQDWGLDWHRNEGVEFHFLESGTMPYSLEEYGDIILEPNDMTISRPWQSHKVGNPNVGIGKFYWVIIDVSVRRPHEEWKWPDWITLTENDLARLTKLLRQNEQPQWKAGAEIKNCFLKISDVVSSNTDGSNASKVRLHINELLLLILEMFDNGNVELNESLTDSLRSASHFLDELSNNPEELWTIEKMAQSAGLGATRFTHHCKQLTNMTPMQYLAVKRVELAKKRLIDRPEVSVSEIAHWCGFSTSQYFSTVFKKHEKCSPAEYRKMHKIA